jgi:transcriptional regulator with XRE-family HTH domain
MERKRAVDRRVGARLAEIRGYRGLSQSQLAKAIDVTVGAIQAYEHGRARISIERLEKLARALQCEPANLLPRKLKQSLLILPPKLGFYGRRAHSKKVDVDAQIMAACGLPPDAPSHLAWERSYDRIHADNRARVDFELARCVNPRDGIFNMQYRLLGWDGVERCILDLGHMTFDEAGEPIRLQGMMLDITHEPRTSNASDRIATFLAAVTGSIWKRR